MLIESQPVKAGTSFSVLSRGSLLAVTFLIEMGVNAWVVVLALYPLHSSFLKCKAVRPSKQIPGLV